MSKALVIKNADFSVNKVSTITFDEEIPCTGVSFDSASVTVTSLGSISVPYTVTPSNTTDAVRIVSSDPSVVSVNGTALTAVGIGSCILTVTCGSQSDSCSVAVDVAIDPYVVRGFINVLPSSVSEGDDQIVDVSYNTTNRVVLCKQKSETGLNAIHVSGTHPFTPPEVTQIVIPNNATALQVHAENVYNSSVGLEVDFTDNDTYTSVPVQSNMIHGYKFVSSASFSGGSASLYSVTETIPIPDGATGFVVYIRPRSNTDALVNATSEQDLVDYCEDVLKVSLQYLAAN